MSLDPPDQNTKPWLFNARLASSETKYVEVPIRNGALGVFIGWPDATSNATITLELTSLANVSAETAGRASEWRDSGVSITGPAASAEGATVVNVENIRQRRARLKIVTAAVTYLDIRDGTAP
jgi:hypothetical protein